MIKKIKKVNTKTRSAVWISNDTIKFNKLITKVI